jgi:hypothetical protein
VLLRGSMRGLRVFAWRASIWSVKPLGRTWVPCPNVTHRKSTGQLIRVLSTLILSAGRSTTFQPRLTPYPPHRYELTLPNPMARLTPKTSLNEGMREWEALGGGAHFAGGSMEAVSGAVDSVGDIPFDPAEPFGGSSGHVPIPLSHSASPSSTSTPPSSLCSCGCSDNPGGVLSDARRS